MTMFKFVESASFSRRVARYLSEADQQFLQTKLLENPRSGLVIRGSGGVRKLRWRTAGRGKQGGLRVIYVVDWSKKQILMLTIYAKNEQDDIPLKLLKQIRKRL
ncbi:MAG: type II toxin-antitoxin system RelE/ParE family toxin [Gammaproteobacteria bacterium]